ncbi:MAG TPA: tetratricopeptide repeat protein [Terriglobales bacterium]|nr:tetratricopeptide repeat protein [Terriglobales bacterium]
MFGIVSGKGSDFTSTVAPVQGKPDGNLSVHALFNSKQKKFVVLSLVLVAATLLLFNPLSECRFLNYDDNDYITENLHVQSGLSWSNFVWAFTTTDVANWHPLTWLSYMVDYQIFKLNPAGYHLTNLLLHVLNVVLLFSVLYYGTGFLWRSWIVAALFAFHPLNVQSVAWVAERKNVLSTLFWLLAIAAYGWYVHKPGMKRYLAVVAFFVLGLMAKPMVVTLPFVLLLLDYWPFGRIGQSNGVIPPAHWRRLFLEKAPLVLLSVISSIITLIAQKSLEATKLNYVVPLDVRLKNVLFSYAEYIFKTFWPTRLAVFYPLAFNPPPLWKLIVAGFVLVSLSTLALLGRKHRYLLTGWLWYLATLVPVIGFIQIGAQAIADRYVYIPLIGFYVFIVWAIADWSNKLQIPKYFLPVASFCVLIALSVDTRHQLEYWHDSVSLWSHALEVTANNNIAQANLTNALEQSGRSAEALVGYRILVGMSPKSTDAHYYYASSLLRNGRPEKAIIECKLALQLTDDPRSQARTHALLGRALAISGRNQEARIEYGEAISLDPQQSFAYLRLGLLEESEGNSNEAILNFTKSIQIAPSDLAYLHLGKNLESQNRLQEALIVYQQAVKIYPTLGEAQQSVISIQRKLLQNEKSLRTN